MLVSLASGDVLSKKLLWARSKRFLPAYSSRVLMVSCLMFRSFIHFEFIFVYGVRKWSRFILHVVVQFSQHHSLKQLGYFLKIVFNVYFLRETETEWKWKRDRERKGDTESEAGSRL